jgi:hypothetical protein
MRTFFSWDDLSDDDFDEAAGDYYGTKGSAQKAR